MPIYIYIYTHLYLLMHYKYIYIYIYIYVRTSIHAYVCMECARGVMVIVAGIGHGDTNSNPGLIAFHIALIPLRKV